MSRADTPTSTPSIEALLRRGLDHYGRNEVKEAIATWREVLRLDPTHEQALDFLETAGAIPEKRDAQVLPFSAENAAARASSVAPSRSASNQAPRTAAPPSASETSSRVLSIAPEEPPQLTTPDGDLADAELKNLLIEQRFEDALARLYSLRSKRPRDQGLSRSIQLLREKLADVYSEQLVHLDRVPHLTSVAEQHAFSSDERHIATLIDGISSFGDIVAASKLGRVPSLRILCQLQQANLLTSSSSSLAAPRRLGAGPKSSAKAAQPTTPASAQSSAYQPPPNAKPIGTFRPSVAPADPVFPSTPNPPRDLMPSPFDERPPPFGDSGKPGGGRSSDTLPKSRPEAPPVKDEAARAYEARFAQAMQCYLVRDFERAIELFRACEAERPDDPRPRHNLKAIQNRTGKS
jgi:tetratricopeptide (TPR) repeat protein